MKLRIFYLMAAILSIFIWGKFQVADHFHSARVADSVKSGEDILSRDRKRLEKNLKKEILQDENWVKVNDYSIEVKNLVTKKNAKELFKLSNESISDLASCLKKDFCGMERRSDDDSYFDDSRTPGHILLGRNLEIMYESLKIDPELKKEVNWDLIRELTDSANEKVQVIAVELLKNFNTRENGTERLIKIVENFSGNSKADALVELSSRASEDDHSLLLNAIEKSLAGDDPNTAISVVEKLGKMHLAKNEIERVSKNLCHYKENGADEPNWKMINYVIGKLDVDLDKICD